MKKVLAVLLAAVMLCVPLAGCYKSADVLTIDGYAVYPGLYLYFQLQAISEAGVKLSYMYSGKDIFRQEIDGIASREWINWRTVELAREFVFVEREYERLVTDSESLDFEMSYYEYTLKNEWQQLNYFYSRNGIGYETYCKMFEYTLKSNHVFNALYVDEGGELEAPPEEVKDFFINNYTFLDYLRLEKPDDDNVELTEAEVENLMDEALELLIAAREATRYNDVYADSVNTGIEAAFELFISLNEISEDEAEYLRDGMVSEDVIVKLDSTDFEESLIEELFAAQYNTYQVLETEEHIYVFCRRSMLEYDEDSLDNYRTTIITELFSEAFKDYVTENSAFLPAYENRGARRYFSLNKVYIS